MLKLEASAASAIVGVAAFQIWDSWSKNAPSIQECRDAHADDTYIRQQLLDSEITVGSMALVIGGALSLFMRDWTPVALMLIVFGFVAFLHHWILAAPSHKK